MPSAEDFLGAPPEAPPAQTPPKPSAEALLGAAPATPAPAAANTPRSAEDFLGPQDTGYFGAGLSGLRKSAMGPVQTAQTLAGGTPQYEPPKTLAEQPVEWGDLAHPDTLAKKAVFQLSSSVPEIAGGLIGGYMGASAAAPVAAATIEAPPVAAAVEGGGALTGAALGAAAGNMLKTLGPNFATALHETNGDGEAAWSLAMKRTAIEGGATGIGWRLFSWTPFEGTVKNMMFQAFGVQPGVAAASRGAQNVVEGQPLTQGMATDYPGAVVGTLVPMAGHALLTGRGGHGAEQPPPPAAGGAPGVAGTPLTDMKGLETIKGLGPKPETPPASETPPAAEPPPPPPRASAPEPEPAPPAPPPGPTRPPPITETPPLSLDGPREGFPRYGLPKAGDNVSFSTTGERTERVGIGADIKRLIDLFGPKMYSGNMPDVTMKELLQNSWDGIKAAYASGKLKAGEGDIGLHLDRENRIMTVRDNGAGMTPETVKDAFLTIGGTEKGGLAEKDRSGGFGVAKMAFIFGNEGLHLETVKDGVKTVLHTTGKELLDGNAKLVTTKTSEPNGTVVAARMPESFKTSDGSDAKMWFPDTAAGMPIFQRPLLGDVKVHELYPEDDPTERGKTGKVLPIGRYTDLTDTPKFTTAKFPWGDIDVHLGTKKTGGYRSDHSVLSSGLFQFQHEITDKPGSYQHFPYSLIFDVKPNVEAADKFYPFTKQREGWNPTVKADIGALNTYLQKIAMGREANDVGSRFLNADRYPNAAHYSPSELAGRMRGAAGNLLRPIGLKLQKLMPKANTFMADALPEITIKDGKAMTGRKVLAKDKEDFTTSDGVSLDKKNFSIPNVYVPHQTPIFHNNLNVDIVKAAAQSSGIPEPRLHYVIARFGTIVKEFQRELGKLSGYGAYLSEPRVGGVSLDKGYHGVHIRVPYSGFFLNPFSHAYDSTEALASAHTHTLIHEAAHTLVSGHNENFTTVLARLYGDLPAASPRLLANVEANLHALIDQHRDAYEALRNVYQHPDTKNLAGSSEGEHTAADDRRPSAGDAGRAADDAEAVPHLDAAGRPRTDRTEDTGTARGEPGRHTDAAPSVDAIAKTAPGHAAAAVAHTARDNTARDTSRRIEDLADIASQPAAKPVSPTTPEPARDIAAQIRAMVDPRTTKDAVFVAAGNESAIPHDLPANVIPVRRAEGTLLTTDRAKAETFQRAPAVDDAMLARMLGYPETKANARAGGGTRVVQARDSDGNVAAEAVTSGARAGETAAALQQQAQPGSRIVSLTPEETQARRANPDGGGAAPPGAPPPPAAGGTPPGGGGGGFRRLVARIPVPQILRDAAAKVLDFGRDIQMWATPMAHGIGPWAAEARAMAKDFGQARMLSRWEWNRAFKYLTEKYDAAARMRMWDALDEHGVAVQQGLSTDGIGLNRLSAQERADTEELHRRITQSFDAAREVGIHNSEGLPFYAPRMVIDVATPDAKVVRDIRTLALAASRLDEAVAGRTLVNAVAEAGKRIGQETVSEGGPGGRSLRGGPPGVGNPIEMFGANVRTTTAQLKHRKYLTREETEAAAARVPEGSDRDQWFTLNNPAFTKWVPRFDADGKPVVDPQGNKMFDRRDIWVHRDFEGPLRAVLTEKPGAAGRIMDAVMQLKAGVMKWVMFTPFMHRFVVMGKIIPAAPMDFIAGRIGRTGRIVKNDPEQMREFIGGGMNPVGRYFARQDISDLSPAARLDDSSWEAKLLSAVPGLFSERAGEAVKNTIDRFGNFMHNTLLWDKIGEWQAGLAAHYRDDLLQKGYSRDSAVHAAAHFANQYVSTLSPESMSASARALANTLMFSRTYTISNIGAFKQAVAGLPRDLQAQILRDRGAQELAKIQTYAKRRAVGIIIADMTMFYAGNSLLQAGVAMAVGNSSLDQEGKNFARRLNDEIMRVGSDPLQALNPFGVLGSLTPMSDNEPGKDDRVFVGHANDGTGVYMRNPVGKFAEELKGYATSPIDMFRRKESTLLRPLMQLLSNDAGFGHKVYDPDDNIVHNAARVAALFAGDETPAQTIKAVRDFYRDPSVKLNWARIIGSATGFSISQGYPGGEREGLYHHEQDQQKFRVQEAMPDIRQKIKAGDINGGVADMQKLGMDPREIRAHIDFTLHPDRFTGGQMRRFERTATPDQHAQMQRYTADAQQRRAEEFLGPPK